MADMNYTTFGDFEKEERFKKLESSLKLSLLNRNRLSRASDDGHSKLVSPNISSINSDSIDFNPSTSFSHISAASGSEILGFSKNLKGILPKRSICNFSNALHATSSVKDYNVKQNYIDRRIMPPPTINKIYHVSKTSNKAGTSIESFNKLAQSSTSNQFPLKDTTTNTPINTHNNKIYLHSPVPSINSTDKTEKIIRKFSKWKVLLNNDYQLIIKGTLECGRIGRSKPVIKRYSAARVESIYKTIYILEGAIVDEKNELPDYIRGKFHNGFPDDWENVRQIWVTFVNQGCPVIFRWPMSIADSDDDINSAVTDLTYTNMTSNKRKMIESSKTIESASLLKNVEKKSVPERSEMIKQHRNTIHDMQTYEQNCAPVSSPIFSEKDIPPVVQAKSTSNKENDHNVRINKRISYILLKRLENVFYKDKLDVIIRNMMDQNCSVHYIDKIMDMIDCLDYLIPYKSEANPEIKTNSDTSKSEIIPLQSIFIDNNNYTNTDKFEGATVSENHMHSTDLGYGSIKNDTNSVQLNTRNNVEQKNKNRVNLDKSESEIYAGIRIIPFDRVLQTKEPSKRILQRKIKKQTRPEYIIDPSGNTDVKFLVPSSDSVIIKKKYFDESCATITESEIEVPNVRNVSRKVNVVKTSENIYPSERALQKFDKFNKEEVTVDSPTAQSECFSETRRSKKHTFIKDLDISFDDDIPYSQRNDVHNKYTTNFGMKEQTVQEAESHIIPSRNTMTVANDSSTFGKKASVSRNLNEEFVKQPESQVATQTCTPVKVKPVIISSMPYEAKVKLMKVDQQKLRELRDSDKNRNQNIDNMDSDIKQLTNIFQPIKVDEKITSKTPGPSKTAIVAQVSTHSNMVDNKKEYDTSNAAYKGEIETNNVYSANTVNSTENSMKQSKHSENNFKKLMAWVPYVVNYSKTELGLIFQGKLLNEAGHVMNRNFSTDVVLKRLSPRMIETVNHSFYELYGCMNDRKHDIPKELVRQCHNGCPAKIEQFCLKWKAYQFAKYKMIDDSKVLSPFDTSTDLLTVPVSSRGRKLVPPLSYWKGERVHLKDDIPIYSPGNALELLKSSEKSPKMTVEKMIDSKQSNRKSVSEWKLSEENEASEASKNRGQLKSPTTKTTNNARKSYDTNLSPPRVIKRSTVQQLTFSSDSSFNNLSNNESDENSEGRKRRMSPHKTANKHQPTTHQRNIKSSISRSEYTMKLRKRPKIEESLNRISNEVASKLKKYNTHVAHCASTNESTEYKVTYSRYQKKPWDDLLSENQVSPT